MLFLIANKANSRFLFNGPLFSGPGASASGVQTIEWSILQNTATSTVSGNDAANTSDANELRIESPTTYTGNFYAEWTVPNADNTWLQIGFGTASNTAIHYMQLQSANIQINVDTVYTFDTPFSGAGAVLRISRVDGVLTFAQNGVVFYTTPASTYTEDFYVTASLAASALTDAVKGVL